MSFCVQNEEEEKPAAPARTASSRIRAISAISSSVASRSMRWAESAKAEVSGVNLDEEAADLVRFQQAYQAAAQVISIANTLFDSLLGAVRR